MPHWDGELIYRKAGKSYDVHPHTFVAVEASNMGAAFGKAWREAKKKLPKGTRMEAATLRLTRRTVTADESEG